MKNKKFKSKKVDIKRIIKIILIKLAFFFLSEKFNLIITVNIY